MPEPFSPLPTLPRSWFAILPGTVGGMHTTGHSCFSTHPSCFSSGLLCGSYVRFVAEYLYQQGKDKAGSLSSEPSPEGQRTVRFWIRDSLRVCFLYVTTCVVGDMPMAVNYFAAVRGWPLHWWWSNVVAVCLLVMVAAWWTLDRIYALSLLIGSE